jgi:hypothetical protein
VDIRKGLFAPLVDDDLNSRCNDSIRVMCSFDREGGIVVAAEVFGQSVRLELWREASLLPFSKLHHDIHQFV